MAAVVGVHGIAQQHSTPEQQSRIWSDGLRLGVTAAGNPGNSVPSLGVPFYGWLFRAGSPYLGADDDEVIDTEEEAFVAEALDEDLAGLSDAEHAELELAAQTLGLRAFIPPSWLRGAAAIDRRWGGGRAILRVGVLRQVYAYLYRTGAGEVIRQVVAEQLAADTRVLVGHSLGSVIVYDLLRRGAAPQVRALVTLGSPLALATVRRALTESMDGVGPDRADLTGVVWSNVHDESDVVTGGHGLSPRARDFPVDNGRADPHALQNYLAQKETGAAVPAGVRG